MTQNPNDKDLGIPEIPMKKVIVVDCEICNKTLSMPVPRDAILKSPLPVTDITYVHGDPEHALVAQIDKDFAVRRRRASLIVFEKDYVE